jgi:plasmid stabilization system protein ParE
VSLEFHPAVAKDLAEAVRRYDPVSPRLGEQFLEEFRHVVKLAARHPGRFHPVGKRFRRANLKRFPYHFLYREIEEGIRVTLVRHHRRDPAYGLERE